MTDSAERLAVLSDSLNDQMLTLQGPACLLPDCTDPWVDKAHIEPSGMGGQPSLSNPENLVGLCRYHHDVFDGRELHGRQRMLRTLMRFAAAVIRERRPNPGPLR